MAYIQGAVYAPPSGGNLPYVAVLFSPSGEVLTARAVPSIPAGEQLIQDVLSSAAEAAGTNLKIIK
jgi:hypothetical protein